MMESTPYIPAKYIQDVKMKPLPQRFKAVQAILERKDMRSDIKMRLKDKLFNSDEEKTNQPREIAEEAAKAVEEEYSMQDGTQSITVQTRYNNIILQKNIVPPGFTELGRQNTNQHQQPNVIDNQSDVHVVTSTPAVHSAVHRLCLDAGGGSDSDEEERSRRAVAVPQIPNDRQNVDVPKQRVLDVMDTMLNERNLNIPIETTFKAFHHRADCQNCDLQCHQIKTHIVDAIMKIYSGNFSSNNVDDVFLILYGHAKSCSYRNAGLPCNVPLCGSLIDDMFSVLQDNADFLNKNDKFHVYKKDQSTNKELHAGVNFNILWSKSIGSGGFGDVYSSWFKMDGKDSIVAIKKVDLPDVNELINGRSGLALRQERLAEFQRLKCLLPHLSNIHICAPHLMLQSDNCLLQIMPLGKMTLRKHLSLLLYNHRHCLKKVHFECNSGMTIAQVLHYFSQMLNALIYLHEQELLVGDVKPENMVLDGNGVLQLIDLDTIRPETPRSRTGTPGYAGTEVYQGRTERRSDVHAAVSILPEMLGLFMMPLQWDDGNPNIVQTTIDRNNLVFRFMMQFEHLKPFAALFRWGTTADVNARPTTIQLAEMFYTHESFNELRRQHITAPTTVQIIHENDPNESQTVTVFKNWMMKRLPRFKE